MDIFKQAKDKELVILNAIESGIDYEECERRQWTGSHTVNHKWVEFWVDSVSVIKNLGLSSKTDKFLIDAMCRNTHVEKGDFTFNDRGERAFNCLWERLISGKAC